MNVIFFVLEIKNCEIFHLKKLKKILGEAISLPPG